MDIAEVVDRAEIEALLTGYTRAIDTGDWDRLDAVFTSDAHIDYRQSGGIEGEYALIKPWLAEMLPLFPKRMHLLGQTDVAFAGDQAVSATYFLNPMTYAEQYDALWEYGGIYHHRLRRTPSGWRSFELVEEIVWKRLPANG